MPIFYDRLVDQVEDLLPDFYREDGPRFVSFLKAYFEFLEKGQLIYKDAADIDYIGLEDGTTEGEALIADGTKGNLIQEAGTYAPASITNAKINYEVDVKNTNRLNTQLPFATNGLSAIIITHAHLDHMGKIPLLNSNGFNGISFKNEDADDLAKKILQIRDTLKTFNSDEIIRDVKTRFDMKKVANEYKKLIAKETANE